MAPENPDSMNAFYEADWRTPLDPDQPISMPEVVEEIAITRSGAIQEYSNTQWDKRLRLVASIGITLIGVVAAVIAGPTLSKNTGPKAKPVPTPRPTPGITLNLDLKNSSKYELGPCSPSLDVTLNRAEKMFASTEHNEDNIQVAKIGEVQWCIFYNGPKGRLLTTTQGQA